MKQFLFFFITTHLCSVKETTCAHKDSTKKKCDEIGTNMEDKLPKNGVVLRSHSESNYDKEVYVAEDERNHNDLFNYTFYYNISKQIKGEVYEQDYIDQTMANNKEIRVFVYICLVFVFLVMILLEFKVFLSIFSVALCLLLIIWELY
ncbi:hypothetical protein NGRA_0846 [Nosema granulosis]|uniref:Uncharacterized protein n=1 Tax=Nosema granulosis TaxID=83296 RepID=A0A9P6H039_9MICR|nr:hypothetical protein NGRA_0846 [Nosema granulosis]